MHKWLDHILEFSAADWLKIPVTEPERVFSNERSHCEAERHALLKKWHPDVNKDPQAVQVFQHIQELFRVAISKIENGRWVLADRVEFSDRHGRQYALKFRRVHNFELGRMYVGDENLLFEVDTKHDVLFRTGVARISDFKYASADMQKEMKRFLPAFKKNIQGIDHEYLLLAKAPDVVPLQDLLDHCNGQVPVKHVAWIISSMLNVLCYLWWAGLTHNAVALDTFFVSPRQHNGLLLGGWWYSRPEGTRLPAVPTRTAALMTYGQRHSALASISLDQDLVRAVGRELLGDPVGTKLHANPEIPKVLAEWLLSSTTQDPVKDYGTWLNSVLPAAFGKRRFQKWDLTPTDIYAKT